MTTPQILSFALIACTVATFVCGRFRHDVVSVVALVVAMAIAPLLARLKSLPVQVPALAGATALLSMLTKNVGALAILMPTAIKLGRS